ncbi:hypothetical protein [Shigella phage VB_Ship_A7]|uniref:Uncharacterized protein n=1 Tax=Shigella phage VB_Ship_A7 TaxID=2562138 RepID=A0A4D6DRQ7_9CAUD|nr:hypothetical protein HOV37_gp33 [Shigella phage VB_Ship_A7]QBZ69011.1 hypothetical protein [Shigella phage VB_Ship_A7]
MIIKVEYVGEDDMMALVKRHDIFFAERTWDGKFYKIMNKHGEEVYLSRNEVIEYDDA